MNTITLFQHCWICCIYVCELTKLHAKLISWKSCVITAVKNTYTRIHAWLTHNLLPLLLRRSLFSRLWSNEWHDNGACKHNIGNIKTSWPLIGVRVYWCNTDTRIMMVKVIYNRHHSYISMKINYPNPRPHVTHMGGWIVRPLIRANNIAPKSQERFVW